MELREVILREILVRQENYAATVLKAASEHNASLRQLLEKVMSGSATADQTAQAKEGGVSND
jgi:hypothetical protein